MDSLGGPSLAPSILSGIKQALSYGLVSVVISTGYAVFDFYPSTFFNLSTPIMIWAQSIWHHSFASLDILPEQWERLCGH